MWQYLTLQDQIFYIVILNIIILSFSAAKVMWIMINIEFDWIILNPILDPIIVLLLFGMVLLSYILCLQGSNTLSKRMLIPFFLLVPIKTIFVVGFVWFISFHANECTNFVSSYECILYPVAGITWIALNSYLLVITIMRFKEITSLTRKQQPWRHQPVQQLLNQRGSKSKQNETINGFTPLFIP